MSINIDADAYDIPNISFDHMTIEELYEDLEIMVDSFSRIAKKRFEHYKMEDRLFRSSDIINYRGKENVSRDGVIDLIISDMASNLFYRINPALLRNLRYSVDLKKQLVQLIEEKYPKTDISSLKRQVFYENYLRIGNKNNWNKGELVYIGYDIFLFKVEICPGKGILNFGPVKFTKKWRDYHLADVFSDKYSKMFGNSIIKNTDMNTKFTCCYKIYDSFETPNESDFPFVDNDFILPLLLCALSFVDGLIPKPSTALVGGYGLSGNLLNRHTISDSVMRLAQSQGIDRIIVTGSNIDDSYKDYGIKEVIECRSFEALVDNLYE